MGDALSERHRDRIGINALSLKPCALPALSQTLSETLRELEGSFVEGSLTQGHGLHHRCSVFRHVNTFERYQAFTNS